MRRMSPNLKVVQDQQEEVEGGANVEMQAEVARLSAELKASQAVVTCQIVDIRRARDNKRVKAPSSH